MLLCCFPFTIFHLDEETNILTFSPTAYQFNYYDLNDSKHKTSQTQINQFIKIFFFPNLIFFNKSLT